MKKYLLNLFTFFAFVLLTSCGSSLEKPASNDPLSDSDNFPATLDVSEAGATLELPDFAMTIFPANSFSSPATVKVKSVAIDGDSLAVYKIASEVSGAGNAYGLALVINVSKQPSKDVLVKFEVPELFLDQLKDGAKPALFAQFIQTGADDEKIDDFFPLESSFEDNVLTATVPVWAFSNNIDLSSDADWAYIVLGSLPSSSQKTQVVDDSFFLSSKNFSSDCKALFIGSPLENDLEITSKFGLRTHPISKKTSFHYGVDYRAAVGDSVLAAADGVIENVGYDYNQKRETGWGVYVLLLHADGSQTRYAHLETGSTDDLTIGEAVSKGEIIGRADTTGGVTGPHLHFEYILDGVRIDPSSCINDIAPLSVISTGDVSTSYGPYFYGTRYNIQLNVPDKNGINDAECEKAFVDESYSCFCNADENSVEVEVFFLEGNGSVNASCKITDDFGNQLLIPINTSWDCCDDPETGFVPNYCSGDFGEKLKPACYILGDCADRCGMN